MSNIVATEDILNRRKVNMNKAKEAYNKAVSREEIEKNRAERDYNKARYLIHSINRTKEMTDSEVKASSREHWFFNVYGGIEDKDEIGIGIGIKKAYKHLNNFRHSLSGKAYRKSENASFNLNDVLEDGVNNRSLTESEYNFIVKATPQQLVERYHKMEKRK